MKKIPFVLAILTLSTSAFLGAAIAQQPEPAATGESDNWPDPNSSSWKSGSIASKTALAALAVGQSKDQVRGLLGVPHFSEGYFNPRTWIYKFMTPSGDACLFRINFENRLLKNTEWQFDACKNGYSASM